MSLSAEGGVVTRGEGFLQIWRSVQREVEEVSEKPFIDVRRGEEGFEELTFAKARGILDDARMFRPLQPLILRDALLWLLRTRNVAALDVLGPENLPVLRKRYPIAPPEWPPDRTMTMEELQRLLSALDTLLREEVHNVSLYAEDFHGDATASGEPFDMYALTAAHRTLPFGTLVRVTNRTNGKSVIVRINDRGPYIPGRDMDLSLAAFTEIAERARGVITATFERLGDVAVVGPCGAKPREQKRIARGISLRRGIPSVLPLGNTLSFVANQPFILRSIRYPDGTRETIETWIRGGDAFSFVPAVSGTYRFMLGTAGRQKRVMRMDVVACGG